MNHAAALIALSTLLILGLPTVGCAPQPAAEKTESAPTEQPAEPAAGEEISTEDFEGGAIDGTGQDGDDTAQEPTGGEQD